jgi:hypothetical protein
VLQNYSAQILDTQNPLHTELLRFIETMGTYLYVIVNFNLILQYYGSRSTKLFQALQTETTTGNAQDTYNDGKNWKVSAIYRI